MSTLTVAFPHSRVALACVIAAHVAIAWSAVQLLKRQPLIEPVPITLSLLREETQEVDIAPQPLPVLRKSPPPPPRVELPEPARPMPHEPVQIQQAPPPEIQRKPPDAPPPPDPIVDASPPPMEAPPNPIPQEPAPQAITTQPPAVAAAAPAAIESPPPPARTHVVESAPVFNADYLHNPYPVYPALSRRMGEQGLVLLRVLVTAKGDPSAIELKTGCGYARLDRAAQEAVRQWKFVPARRGEQPVDAWVLVPIRFSLKG